MEASSPFQLCRRCHFHKITDILDSFTRDYMRGTLHPPQELLLHDPQFLQELLHPAREQALLQLLSTLHSQNKIQYHLLVTQLKEKSVFPILMTKRILAHQPGPRCCLYRTCMRDPRIFTTDTLSWNCWSCIAWCVKQQDARLLQLYTQSFGRNFSRLTHDMYLNTGPPVFVDYFVSLHLIQKEHHIRILTDHMIHRFPLEEVKSFLLGFLQQPAMYFVYAKKLYADYIPLPLRGPDLLASFQQHIKESIKNRTDIFKEELIIKTWHPRRLFPWCLDLEELADFGYSSANRNDWQFEL